MALKPRKNQEIINILSSLTDLRQGKMTLETFFKMYPYNKIINLLLEQVNDPRFK